MFEIHQPAPAIQRMTVGLYRCTHADCYDPTDLASFWWEAEVPPLWATERDGFVVPKCINCERPASLVEVVQRAD